MRKWIKRISWVVILLAAAAGGVFFFSSGKNKIQHTTEEAKIMDVNQTVSVTGTINPEVMIDLGFKTSGIVEKMNVNIGDQVKKNQLLAKVDTGALWEERKASQEDIEYQEETLDHMKDNRRTYEEEQRDAQKALIRKAEALSRVIGVKISDTYIYAPIPGTIIKRNFDLGEIAVYNTTVLTIADGELEIETNIPESDIIKIALEQNAEVSLDAFPSDQTFNAKVVEIEPAATVIQDVVYYKVKLKFDLIDPSFKPGMSCDVDIKTAEKNNVVAIPLRAVKTEGGEDYVEILKDEKNNIIEKVFVTTGLEGDDGIVEIVSGLKGGEKVITLTSQK